MNTPLHILYKTLPQYKQRYNVKEALTKRDIYLVFRHIPLYLDAEAFLVISNGFLPPRLLHGVRHVAEAPA